jgi:acyl carrier protein
VPDRLIAYVVLADRRHVTIDELRPYLRERLMEPMIPSDLVILDRMPVSANGKVNRQALPAPPETAPVIDRGSSVNPTEAQLIEIWQELLNVPSIGVHANFFDLGGHSLLAARMMDRIERVWGVRIPVASLFAASTIEALAAVLAEGSGSKTKFVNVQAGAGRPFIFFHGDLFGGGLYCRKFAKCLGPNQKFLSIAPLGWDGGAVPATVEEAALAQLATVLEIQPDGPYALGGYCNGGLIAFETARMLQSTGKKVDVIALVDATAN